jgi:hypothetical protein
MTLVELLANLGGVRLSFRRDGATLAAAVLELPGERQVLVIERTYRQGICAIVDPTPEESETARNGDLWQLWNSERAERLFSVV